MDRPYRDGTWLRERYRDDGLTQQEIAEECDVSPRTIRKYLSRFDIETRAMEGEDHPMHGEERSDEVKRKIASTLQGRELSTEWREKIAEARMGERVPEEVRAEISDALTGREVPEETREKMSRSTAGERNPNWQGGYSRYYGPGWSVARDRVHERDEVCRHCGHDGSDRRLEVHHIIPVRRFRESKDSDVTRAHHPDNLVLLCRRCHGRADHGSLEFESGVESPTGQESSDDS